MEPSRRSASRSKYSGHRALGGGRCRTRPPRSCRRDAAKAISKACAEGTPPPVCCIVPGAPSQLVGTLAARDSLVGCGRYPDSFAPQHRSRRLRDRRR
jgi:hypothetical protein